MATLTRQSSPDDLETTLWHIWQHNYAGDFAAGVQLLTTHNPGVVTKQILTRLRMLATGADYIGEYEKGKLAYALHRTPLPADLEQIRVNPSNPQPSALPNPRHEIRVNPPNPQPSALQELTSDRAIALHKEHSHVHALLVAATTDEQRAEYARDIKERITPALDAEYDRLRAAAQTSEGSGEATGPILNAGDARAFKKLQSVRSRISTLRKKLSTEKDPKRKLKLEQELEDKLAEKERLEGELA